MAVKFEAPFPSIYTTTYLPNPQLGDSDAPTGSFSTKRTLGGRKVTYIKSRDERRRFILDFALTRSKYLELNAFVNAYHSHKIRYTDHFGLEWVGNFTNNPFDGTTSSRTAQSLGGSVVSIRLEFEGNQQ